MELHMHTQSNCHRQEVYRIKSSAPVVIFFEGLARTGGLPSSPSSHLYLKLEVIPS